MLDDDSSILINLFDSQSNNSDNNITPNLSLFSEFNYETSAFKEIQEEDSTIKTGPNSDSDNETYKKIFYCPCCLSTVEIQFKSKKEIKIKCQKGRKKVKILFDIEDYYHENNIEMINNEKIYNLYCRRHEEKNVFNKYERYCISCKFDLCEDCNFIKRCENHDFKNLNLDNNIKKFLDNYLQNNDKVEDEDEKSFCKLIKVLMYTNEEFPNYKTLKSLENLYNFLINEKKINENELEKNEINEDETGIFIKDRKDLTKQNLLISKIYKITMDKNNFRNIKFLYKTLSKNKDNIFLTKLTLSGNNLTTIKYLVKGGSNPGLFPNLKHLDLSRNNLGDENIKYIEKLNCINLEEIYLYTNKFTDYNLFNVLNKKFKNIQQIYVGFNRFQKNSDNIKELIFPKLTKIGLNYTFNENNYKNLAKFKLEKLEYLFVQNNGISQLNILEKMNLFSIKEILLTNNELEEIDVNFFIKYPNLERVYLGDTISKIINLSKIKPLKSFKYFDFNTTKINLEFIKEKGVNFIKDLEIVL